MDVRWTTLLEEARRVHARLPALQGFCAFPDRFVPQEIAHRHIPGVDLMLGDRGLTSDRLASFRDAVIGAAPLAQWRDTYKGTALEALFHARFACYEIFGVDAPFGTDQMRGFVIYQPAGFHYPWHHHPAQELYLVIAGEGEFAIEGQEPRVLRPGDVAYHPSNAPHALSTHAHPVMAYVLWQGDLISPPEFTYPQDLQAGSA